MKKEVHLLSDINRYYESLIALNRQRSHVNSSAQKLEQKLSKQYGKNLKIDKGRTKRGNVISSSVLTAEETWRGHHSNITKDNVQIRDAALILREAILTAETKMLPDNLTINDIFKGDVEVPPPSEYLLFLLDCRSIQKELEQPLEKSENKVISQDAIFRVPMWPRSPTST